MEKRERKHCLRLVTQCREEERKPINRAKYGKGRGTVLAERMPSGGDKPRTRRVQSRGGARRPDTPRTLVGGTRGGKGTNCGGRDDNCSKGRVLGPASPAGGIRGRKRAISFSRGGGKEMVKVGGRSAGRGVQLLKRESVALGERPRKRKIHGGSAALEREKKDKDDFRRTLAVQRIGGGDLSS